MKYCLVFILFWLCSQTTNGQTINSRKLDSLFNTLQTHDLAMGSIAIAYDGKVIYQKAIGNAVISNNDTISANINTAYRLGSITKMFTAVMIFQLIEEKKLALNDTLKQFFPEMPNSGRITIKNMLYHRSGLANFTNNTNFDDWKDKPQIQQQLLARITSQPTDFEPNAKADYNNSNYLLLGYIIEKICKQPYKNVLNERIIKRVRLRQTYYGDDARKNNEAASYVWFNGQWKTDKAVYLNNFGGAGAVISTPADMLKFINALFAGKLLKATSFAKMKTMVDGYGMGIFPYEFHGHTGLGHNGKTEGFASSLTYYPADKLSIAYCTNGEVYHKALILDAVLSIYFNRPYTIPNFTPIKIDEQLLNSYAGSYSSDNPKISVVCRNNKGSLEMETHGQIMKVDALSSNEFFNRQFGFFFDFSNDAKKLTIKDVESYYELDRQ